MSIMYNHRDKVTIYYILYILLLRFLDVSLPLWLGGAPSVPPGLPLGSSGIDGCVRNVVINGRTLDLDSHVDQLNSNNGCPQVHNTYK